MSTLSRFQQKLTTLSISFLALQSKRERNLIKFKLSYSIRQMTRPLSNSIFSPKRKLGSSWNERSINKHSIFFSSSVICQFEGDKCINSRSNDEKRTLLFTFHAKQQRLNLFKENLSLSFDEDFSKKYNDVYSVIIRSEQSTMYAI